MRALGAEVTRTPEEEGMQGAIRRAKELGAAIPGAFMAAQFENPANPGLSLRHDGGGDLGADGGPGGCVYGGRGIGGNF